ncbi:unnamed protein product [Gadus morhua 'NCC']
MRFSRKSFLRRNSSLFRKKYPQEGQEKSNSIINMYVSTVTPHKEMSPKDLQSIQNISSKVRFRFLHCEDIHDCYLDLFQTHLHFVSNNPSGLTYQGTLPLKELTICSLQQNHSRPQAFAFQINGVSLNPIIVYCANQEEMDRWFGLMKENIEANGGTAFAPESYTRVKLNKEVRAEGREELRNSVNREPIYEWEGSQRDSLGCLVYVTKVRLQHLPCQVRNHNLHCGATQREKQSDRLLVLYPSTVIILSEESDGLFYKGKLPLNMITVTTPCQDVKPNTFRMEGQLINPIVVSCRDQAEFCDWIQHFKAADVPVLSPPPPVYDIIYTPEARESPQFDRWSSTSQGKLDALRLRLSAQSGSHLLPFPQPADEDPLSPGYSEPLCYTSSRPPSVETYRLGSRSSSMSSHSRPERDLRPLSLRYSPQQPLQPPPEGQVYSTPYAARPRGSPPRPDRAPLIKSNSWSTPQSSLSYALSSNQRHSDLCPPRQPLSPLYDEPCTPELYAPGPRPLEPRPLEPRPLEPRPHATQSSWQGSLGLQQTPAPPPPTFKLCTPPLGRRCRRSLVLTGPQGRALGLEPEQGPRGAPAPAPPRLRLNTPPVHDQRLIPSSPISSLSKLPYCYSPDLNSYLRPTEPDDQEMDYDNIWEYDQNTGMIQPTSGIPQQRTGLGLGARGLSAMATQQR